MEYMITLDTCVEIVNEKLMYQDEHWNPPVDYVVERENGPAGGHPEITFYGTREQLKEFYAVWYEGCTHEDDLKIAYEDFDTWVSNDLVVSDR